jgi:type IV fimbrial biogenesis protein FimT
MGKREEQRGITLVEAAVVLAVTAIVASSAAPSFRGFIEKQRLDGVAAQLATDIQFARAEAVLRNTGVRLTLQTQAWGSCYVIHTGNANQCSCSDTGAAQCSDGAQQIKTVQLPANEQVALQGNVGSILFDPLHGTSTPTGTLKLVAASGGTVQHVVNVMGRVRTCSPQGAVPPVSGYAVC